MRILLTSLTVATGLITPLALAATGDLDRSFGSHGRLAAIGSAGGAALFVEAPGTGGILVGGGDVDTSGSFWSEPGMPCTFRASGSSFAGQLGEDGTVDPAFNASAAPGIAAQAIARQADGGIIVLGHEIKLASSLRCSHYSTPVIVRLAGDGSLDTSFGTDGILQLPELKKAASFLLDSSGRVVVVGIGPVDDDDSATPDSYGLTVLRLQPDGTLDVSFGTGGYYYGPAAGWSSISVFGALEAGASAVNVVPAGSGSYRVSMHSPGPCKIVGITSDGTADSAFGTGGIATLRGPGGSKFSCDALESAPDGGLLVAGSARKRGFVARLLASGVPDPAFTVDDAIATSMARVTSVAISADGKLLVAGSGVTGASILRLHATGERDTAFGDEGRTWLDLESESASQPIVRDIAVRDDGSVIAVGGDLNSDRPFVVRLLGDGGGTSRGVISFSRSRAESLPDDKAILRVRRSGGSYGSVSARYRTVADRDAVEHEDFVPESGRLYWAAGDRSQRSIVIDVAQGSTAPEALESFRVLLDDVRGGAGFGTRGATVNILPDGSPGGQIEIDLLQLQATENHDAQFILTRNFYFEGRVCVTLTAKSGSAKAGEDFSASPVTVCWEDQEQDEWKLPVVPITDDDRKEGEETFRIELSNPTGGAILGPNRSATVTLYDND